MKGLEKIMSLEDQYKYLVGAYYGVMEMDEYDLKVYILKDIENYIKDFLAVSPIPNFNYREYAEMIDQKMPLKTKLQDALLVLNKIDGPLDLILMIKRRIKDLNDKQ